MEKVNVWYEAVNKIRDSHNIVPEMLWLIAFSEPYTLAWYEWLDWFKINRN